MKFARLTKIAIPIIFVAALTSFPVNAQGNITSELDLNLLDNIGQSLEEELEQIERELAAIRKHQQDLQDQISGQKQRIGAYSGEIGALGAKVEALQLDIAELELKIDESEVNIKILQERIADKMTEIDLNEGNILGLQTESSERIESNYMDFRLHSSLATDFFTVTDANTYFKDSQYRELIQQSTNKVLGELSEMKIKLDRDRFELEESQISVLRDKAVLDEQHSQLDKMREDLQTQIDSYYSAIYSAQGSISYTEGRLEVSSEDEAKKKAEAERIRQELFNSFSSIGAGQYVLAGTQIGSQGSTGWSTGPHLHFSVTVNGGSQNPCSYLPGGAVDGCGWGNQLQWPLKGQFYYTSGYYSGVNGDTRCFWYNGGYSCSAHPAIDIAHSIWNAPVYAAHDGWLAKGVDQYGALYIVICQDRSNCNNGFKTGYWHLSAY